MKLFFKGQPFSEEEFLNTTENMSACFVKDVSLVIKHWRSGETAFFLNTSGSTGIPQRISFSRDQLIASALMTIERFEINGSDTLLCCLSPQYVAGFMMIVRGLVADCSLCLVEPSKNPLIELSPEINISFAAFLPYQLNQILKQADGLILEKLNRIKTIILGGENVNTHLLEKIKKLRCKIYHTYGMTETLTHIAVKQLNGINTDCYFVPLNGVTINRDERGCLNILAPSTNNEIVITNDLVNIFDNQEFEWLGRVDDIINSGGVKLNPNKITLKSESVIADHFKESNFFYFSIPDLDFGNRLVLLIESIKPEQFVIEDFKTNLHKILDQFEFPGHVFFIKEFEKTDTGKTDRKKTVEKYIKNEFST